MLHECLKSPANEQMQTEVVTQLVRWGVDVNLRNLANKRYFVAANGAGALVGESRSAMMSVHANF